MSERLSAHTQSELERLDEIRALLLEQGCTAFIVDKHPARLVMSLITNTLRSDIRDGTIAAMTAGLEPTSALAAGKEVARLLMLERKKPVDEADSQYA